MYYVIETNYVGPNPNQDKYIDADTIEISTSPAIANRSREPRTEGWCGTTNDWSIYAHGAYATIDEARAAIGDKFGAVRGSDTSGDSFEPENPDIVETYKPGKYAPMSSAQTEEWVYRSICADISADTSDERIAALVAEYESDANREGYTMHRDLGEFMQKRRQELRDDLENAS